MTANNHCEKADKQIPSLPVSDSDQRLNLIFTALSDTRRRYVLQHLTDTKRASVTEIARRIGSWEKECPQKAISETYLTEVEVSLHHIHLPMLRDATLVEYDGRTAVVPDQSLPEIVEVCLEHCKPVDTAD